MSLLAQNMEPNIPSNGGKRISNYIMFDNAFFFMSTTKKVYQAIESISQLYMHREIPQAIRWGRPNLMRSFKKICQRPLKKKDNWVGKQSNTLTWACARFQPNTMATKKQI